MSFLSFVISCIPPNKKMFPSFVTIEWPLLAYINQLFTSGAFYDLILSHDFLLKLNLQKSSIVCIPLLPPKIYKFYDSATILKFDRGSGSFPDPLPSKTSSHSNFYKSKQYKFGKYFAVSGM